MLADEDVGGAVDVEGGGHWCRTSSTADSASEAVMSGQVLAASADEHCRK